MLRSLQIWQLLFAFLSAFWIGCGKADFSSGINGQVDVSVSSSKKMVPPGNRPVRLRMTKENFIIKRGDKAPLAVMVEYVNGDYEEISGKAAIEIEDSRILSLDSGHSLQLRGETLGDTLVTASYAGLSATAHVSVVPLNVVALQVEAANSQIQVGESMQLKVVAILEDGHHLDVTKHCRYETRGHDKVYLSRMEPGRISATGIDRHKDGFARPTMITIDIAYNDFLTQTAIEIIPKIQLKEIRDQSLRPASPLLPGVASKTLTFLYLRKEETITSAHMGAHSSDLKLLDAIIIEPYAMARQEGWYQQSVIMTFAAKWVSTDHAAEYRGQEIKIAVSRDNTLVQNLTINFTWLTTPEVSEDMPSIPKHIFTGTAADPTALPIAFP